MVFALDIDISAWLTWLVLTLGGTIFITRSMWFAWLRTWLVTRLDTYAAYCGGCVGFWIGLATTRLLPLHQNDILCFLISPLLGMMFGYWRGGGHVVVVEDEETGEAVAKDTST
jgi:hypothetical protein